MGQGGAGAEVSGSSVGVARMNLCAQMGDMVACTVLCPPHTAQQHTRALTGDPAAVGSAPVDVARLEGKHVLEGGGGVDLPREGKGWASEEG